MTAVAEIPPGAPRTYHEFRAELTFRAVRWELRREAEQALELEGRRMFVRRRTVLGRMREHKIRQWEGYCRWVGLRPW